MFDYQFIVTKFGNKSEFYIHRFDRELNDEEIQVFMENLIDETVKNVILDRVFKVNK